MTHTIPSNAWDKYQALLPRGIGKLDPKIPQFAERLELECAADYVPSELFLIKLRRWLIAEGRPYVYYFITETAGSHEALDYLIPSTELSRKLLLNLNPRAESVLTGQDFGWAVFVNHEGKVYIGGTKQLITALKKVPGPVGQPCGKVPAE